MLRVLLNATGIGLLLLLVIFLGYRYRQVEPKEGWAWMGWTGLVIILGSVLLLILGVKMIGIYLTPLIWTGYILLTDGLTFSLRGSSLLHERRKDLVTLALLSLGWWLLFELYNLHLQNWVYVGLPENPWARYVGYVWSFATIFPAILETTSLFQALGVFRNRLHRRWKLSDATLKWMASMGFIMLIIPWLVPTGVAQYLFGLVWLGFIFALEPLNYKWNRPSLLREMERGQWQKLWNLLLAGILCGLLWEFWNYWARAGWIYTFPIAQNYKIFQMPLPGYLGFPPFAVECYVLTQFSYGVLAKIGGVGERSPLIEDFGG